MNTDNKQHTERSPVVAIMGHIDHGKSTILSCIRKSSEKLSEAGGITQHISAYEVLHTDETGSIHRITFLDTPGHEAFSGIRTRGATVADIAVLVVSAEDGVKPQTIEALKSITKSNTPFVVAINKIDKADADIEKTKQSLAEHEIYVEGYGGTVPVVSVSGKTGQGIPELLDIIVLMAHIAELSGDPTLPGNGIIIESKRDTQKGISAVCIIKNGTVKKGEYMSSGKSFAPIKMIENYLGKPITEASFSSPIKIFGWDSLPEVGNTFETHTTRESALLSVEMEKNKKVHTEDFRVVLSEYVLPIIVKADTSGSLEAIIQEIKKLSNERVGMQIISSGIGTISENDIRLANGEKKATVIGFHTKVDQLAKQVAERTNIDIHLFSIIYTMTEWLSELIKKSTPKKMEEELKGVAKVLKVFSKVKDRQIIGAVVESGVLTVGSTIKIKRRDIEIGSGKIRGLEQQKKKTTEVSEGKECGVSVEAKIEIAVGDKIENFIIVEK